MERQLAAILYADVAGYSRLTGFDEEQTHRRLDAGLNLLADVIAAHRGRKVHEAGDAILAEFQSVTEAVSAAVEFQHQMSTQNAELADDERLEFRVGVNLGEVIHDRDDIYGEGVNLAARIQELAKPGGVCVSGTVYEQVRGKVEHAFEDLGHQKVKNIAQSIHVYALRLSDTSLTTRRGLFFDTLASPSPLVTGGCMCGEIRYEVTGEELGSGYCHCRMCQRSTGSPATVGTGFRKDDLRVTRGEPKIYVSSLIAQRAFCPTCGSSLWMTWSRGETRGEWIFVHTASLDEPENFAPSSHLGIESQMPWHDIHDDFPRRRCQDSPEIAEAWDSAGISISDYPRNVNVSKK